MTNSSHSLSRMPAPKIERLKRDQSQGKENLLQPLREKAQEIAIDLDLVQSIETKNHPKDIEADLDQKVDITDILPKTDTDTDDQDTEVETENIVGVKKKEVKVMKKKLKKK